MNLNRTPPNIQYEIARKNTSKHRMHKYRILFGISGYLVITFLKEGDQVFFSISMLNEISIEEKLSNI